MTSQSSAYGRLRRALDTGNPTIALAERKLSKVRRWQAVALLTLGIALGIALTASPAGSHVAGWAHNWNKHIKPKADKRYLPGGNLPSGRTIRGTYYAGGSDQGAGIGEASSAISFGWRLSAVPIHHLIPVGTPPPAECRGTAANPQAAPGHLCVYGVTNLNLASQVIVNPVTGTGDQASRYGFSVVAFSAEDGMLEAGGTWAVRSP